MAGPSESGDKMPNLYLVGFLGTGKSAVGQMAAQELGLRFIDSDDAIEQEVGKSVRAIFEEDGVPSFRVLERRFIEERHPDSGCLISCGGGLIVPPGMSELLNSKGIVVCLHAKPETVRERTKDGESRPALNIEDPLTRITELLKERETLYRDAGPAVHTDHRSIAEVAAEVCDVYRRSVIAR